MGLKPGLVFGIIGVVGLVLTYLSATPGPYEVSIGMLRFDPYYLAVTGFTSLVIIAIADVLGITVPEKYYPPRLRD